MEKLKGILHSLESHYKRFGIDFNNLHDPRQMRTIVNSLIGLIPSDYENLDQSRKEFISKTYGLANLYLNTIKNNPIIQEHELKECVFPVSFNNHYLEGFKDEKGNNLIRNFQAYTYWLDVYHNSEH